MFYSSSPFGITSDNQTRLIPDSPLPVGFSNITCSCLPYAGMLDDVYYLNPKVRWSTQGAGIKRRVRVWGPPEPQSITLALTRTQFLTPYPTRPGPNQIQGASAGGSVPFFGGLWAGMFGLPF